MQDTFLGYVRLSVYSHPMNADDVTRYLSVYPKSNPLINVTKCARVIPNNSHRFVRGGEGNNLGCASRISQRPCTFFITCMTYPFIEGEPSGVSISRPYVQQVSLDLPAYIEVSGINVRKQRGGLLFEHKVYGRNELPLFLGRCPNQRSTVNSTATQSLIQRNGSHVQLGTSDATQYAEAIYISDSFRKFRLVNCRVNVIISPTIVNSSSS